MQPADYHRQKILHGVFIAIDIIKPYYDERPLAAGNTHETREYRMRWWDKSVAHGEWSAVQQVVIGQD